MKKKSKRYRVDVYMKWTEEYVVRANTAAEAKRKAWERFKKRPPKTCFAFLADRDDY